MKRLIVLLILAMMAGVVSAQDTKSATSAATPTAPASIAEPTTSIPKTDWLTSFSKIKVDAPINLTLREAKADEDVRIIYDTKGDLTSKFRYDVDKKGTLTIVEKVDPKRTTVTDVVIYYKSLSDVKIAHAVAEFENEIATNIFDLSVSGGATVKLAIKTLDVDVECTGSSRLTIEGETKYLTMRVSTAKIDCSKLSTVSATVEASHSAEVRVVVSERLETTVSTGGKLFYKGSPIILRNHNAIFGGDITNIN